MYKIIWPVLFPKETASKFGSRCLLDREIPISWKDTEKSCQAKKGGMKTQFEKKNSKVGRVYYSDQI